MTDPELVHRAERAYLGAILAAPRPAALGPARRRRRPGALAGLRPQDFADPVHRADLRRAHRPARRTAGLPGARAPARHG